LSMVNYSSLPKPVEVMVYDTEHEANTARGEKSCGNQPEAGTLLEILQNRLCDIRLNDPEEDQGLGNENKTWCDVSKKSPCLVHFFLSA